jgi:prevent-host-death family protein
VKQARIAELKNNLSRYLEYVRAGESILVLDRDEPVARIVPVGQTPDASGRDEPGLARLERRGIIRRGTGGLPEWLGKRKPVRLRRGLLKDLLADRESGW